MSGAPACTAHHIASRSDPERDSGQQLSMAYMTSQAQVPRSQGHDGSSRHPASDVPAAPWRVLRLLRVRRAGRRAAPVPVSRRHAPSGPLQTQTCRVSVKIALVIQKSLRKCCSIICILCIASDTWCAAPSVSRRLGLDPDC